MRTGSPRASRRPDRVPRAGLLPFLKRDLLRHRYVYLMLLPVVAYYVIFNYMPMYGTLMAFQDYSLAKGVRGSPMAAAHGFEHFIRFFQSPYFSRVTLNTLYLNLLSLAFGFPAPVILALLLNEVRGKPFKRTVQTISYLPFFISMVVVAGIIFDFTRQDGLINHYAQILLGMPGNVNMLARTAYYRSIYIVSDIWQGAGFNSIIFIAAISGINPELYEASYMDGAGRWKRLLHVTLPGLATTVVIMLIIQIGSLLGTNLEKVLLLYSPSVYDVADVISSYVYRQGIVMAQLGYSAAVGLLNSVMNFIILIAANTTSRRLFGTSLF
jgi:putative aldouronate transport system permease protein